MIVEQVEFLLHGLKMDLQDNLFPGGKLKMDRLHQMFKSEQIRLEAKVTLNSKSLKIRFKLFSI